MTKYILHGGGIRIDNESNRNFFHEVTKDVPDGGNVLLVYFAVVDEDREEYFRNMKEDFIKNAGDKKLNFILATPEKFMEQLKGAKAVYFHSGDTQKLIEDIEQYPGFTEAIQGKTLAGSSAGASLFSTYRHSATHDTTGEGLGVLPIRLICHYKSENFNVGKEAIEKMNKYPNDLELVILKDFEWRVFET